MELKEFVKNVVKDVTGAVEELATPNSKHVFYIGGDKDGNPYSHNIDFDIAVSVLTNDKKEGGGGIKVLEVIQGGGTISKENTNSTVSRVKFKINTRRI